jgi:hypothetical protein
VCTALLDLEGERWIPSVQGCVQERLAPDRAELDAEARRAVCESAVRDHLVDTPFVDQECLSARWATARTDTGEIVGTLRSRADRRVTGDREFVCEFTIDPDGGIEVHRCLSLFVDA